MLLKQPKKFPNIWANFVGKFVAENYLKLPNLVRITENLTL